ncbi:hypothetical protein [Denitratimonas sp. CY0512]|uniref:hypothetical protein n=1 Tax=Denitratimonas sp. CY0512 TaxID=3131940 RepID=UPI0030ADDE15
MKATKSIKISVAASSLLMSFSIHAGEIEAQNNGGTAWRAGIDGVVIEWSDDGDFSRIYSGYTQPVSVPNTRGIRNAKVIAEEKAKAAIIKFLEQTVATETLTSEVSSDIENTSAQSQNGGPVNYSTETASKMISSLSEFTSSYAKGTLRGVIRLEEGYEASTSEVWVKVGFSNKTMRAASSVREAISNDGKPAHPALMDGEVGTGSAVKSHVRKTEQKDW